MNLNFIQVQDIYKTYISIYILAYYLRYILHISILHKIYISILNFIQDKIYISLFYVHENFRVKSILISGKS